jgi:hypothetical protein
VVMVCYGAFLFRFVSDYNGYPFVVEMCIIVLHSFCLFLGMRINYAFWLKEMGKLFLYVLYGGWRCNEISVEIRFV